jgi:hypothetical protein
MVTNGMLLSLGTSNLEHMLFVTNFLLFTLQMAELQLVPQVLRYDTFVLLTLLIMLVLPNVCSSKD